jgi:Flp pilus assembly protein TadG
MACLSSKRTERGASILEFAIVASIFFTVVFGVIEFGRLFWTHSALRDAARRGARYAVTRKEDAASIQAVKNVVVYGDPNANPATATPLVNGLTTGNVLVEYKNFNGILLSAQATVSITNFKFNFIVPLIGTTIDMPAYRTALPGESAGFIPCDIPSGSPQAPCNIIPN